MPKGWNLQGPFEIEVKILMTDGEQQATVTYGMPKGEHCTREGIEAALVASEKQIQGQMGEDWRLANKQEYFNHLTEEYTHTNMAFALPGGPDWDE